MRGRLSLAVCCKAVCAGKAARRRRGWRTSHAHVCNPDGELRLLLAFSLPSMQEGGAKEAAKHSLGFREHEGLIPSLLAGLARSSVRICGEAPAAPAGQVPLAALCRQSCGRVPADGVWSEPSRQLLRCQPSERCRLLTRPQAVQRRAGKALGSQLPGHGERRGTPVGSLG